MAIGNLRTDSSTILFIAILNGLHKQDLRKWQGI